MLVVFGTLPETKVVFGILVCLVSIKAYSFYQPFDDDGDDMVSEVSQWQLLLILFSGLLILGFPSLTGPGSPIGTLMLVFMFVGPVLTLYVIWITWNQQAAEEAEEQHTEDGTDSPHHTQAVTAVALDSDVIVSGSSDCTVKVYDRTTGHLLHNLKGHDAPVNSVTITKAGEIMSSAQDRTIKIWNIKTGKVRNFPGHDGFTETMVNHALDADTLVSAMKDNTIKVWKRSDGEKLVVCGEPFNTDSEKGHIDKINAVAVFGDLIVSGSVDTTVRCWDKLSGQMLRTLPVPNEAWKEDRGEPERGSFTL